MTAGRPAGSPVAAVAHLFVPDLDAPEVDADDAHHLERVLRVRPGETVTVSDGRGGFRVCAYVAGGRLDPSGEVERAEAPTPSVGVGFALVKGEKPEWIVQKLTECGVDRITPFVAERSVVRWDEAKARRNLDRLRRVAREAAMQSRRRWLPVVESVRSFTDVIERAAWPGATGVALADVDGGPPDVAVASVVLVGPEGGWSDAERERPAPALDGAARVALGPHVLRAETAAVAAGVLLAGLRQGTVAPAAGRNPRS